MVLFVDAVDAIRDDLLVAVLRQRRDGSALRPGTPSPSASSALENLP